MAFFSFARGASRFAGRAVSTAASGSEPIARTALGRAAARIGGRRAANKEAGRWAAGAGTPEAEQYRAAMRTRAFQGGLGGARSAQEEGKKFVRDRVASAASQGADRWGRIGDKAARRAGGAAIGAGVTGATLAAGNELGHAVNRKVLTDDELRGRRDSAPTDSERRRYTGYVQEREALSEKEHAQRVNAAKASAEKRKQGASERARKAAPEGDLAKANPWVVRGAAAAMTAGILHHTGHLEGKPRYNSFGRYMLGIDDEADSGGGGQTLSQKEHEQRVNAAKASAEKRKQGAAAPAASGGDIHAGRGTEAWKRYREGMRRLDESHPDNHQAIAREHGYQDQDGKKTRYRLGPYDFSERARKAAPEGDLAKAWNDRLPHILHAIQVSHGVREAGVHEEAMVDIGRVARLIGRAARQAREKASQMTAPPPMKKGGAINPAVVLEKRASPAIQAAFDQLSPGMQTDLLLTAPPVLEALRDLEELVAALPLEKRAGVVRLFLADGDEDLKKFWGAAAGAGMRAAGPWIGRAASRGLGMLGPRLAALFGRGASAAAPGAAQAGATGAGTALTRAGGVTSRGFRPDWGAAGEFAGRMGQQGPSMGYRAGRAAAAGMQQGGRAARAVGRHVWNNRGGYGATAGWELGSRYGGE